MKPDLRPRGRPRTRLSDERKTSISLDKDLRLAIRRLQLRREENDRPATMRDLLREGITLLLAKEGLAAMADLQQVVSGVVVEMPRKNGA
jgi:hypothetical protein